MLLTNRRSALIHASLAALEATWAAPLWLVIYPIATQPWLVLAAILAAMLGWMLVLELLSRRGVRSPAYEIATVALMGAATVISVRLIVYRSCPPGDLSWLARLAPDALDFGSGVPPAIALLALNVFLWHRASSATSRDITFFSVGVSFRLSLLLFLAAAGVAAYARQIDLTSLVWFFFGAGLLAVAVARVNEKAAESQSAGRPLPLHRLLQLLAAIGVTVGAAGLLSQVLSPAGVRHSLAWLAPVWRALRPLLVGLLTLLARLIEPLLFQLESWLGDLMSAGEGQPLGPVVPPVIAPDQGPATVSPFWNILANSLLVIAVVAAVLVLLAIVLIQLERVRAAARGEEAEEEEAERVTWGGGILGRGVDAVRQVARLLRRFGLGSRLLAAVSVQNIYANLCRLARERGRPRPPAQPPDAYLPTLVQVFGGYEEQLSRITAAYMRVHYGDHPVSWAEMGGLREDYRAVRAGQTGQEAGPAGP